MSRYTFLSAPCDFGDPGWGDSWFPYGAVLLLSPAGMALCVLVFCFLCLVFFLLWSCPNEMTQSCRLLLNSPMNWKPVIPVVVVFCLFCLVFVWIVLVCGYFCCLFAFLLFFVLVLFVCAVRGMTALDYVQVPHQFFLAVLNKQTTSCINLEINDSAMPQSVLKMAMARRTCPAK